MRLLSTTTVLSILTLAVSATPTHAETQIDPVEKVVLSAPSTLPPPPVTDFHFVPAPKAQPPAVSVTLSTRKIADRPKPKPAPVPVPVASPSPAPITYAAPTLNDKVISAVKANLGAPYAYGGTSPAGFDCSGFAQYVYRSAGISLPRTSYAQQASVHHISRSQAVPGDLIFFGSPAYHVGIYAGGNKMWDAPTQGQRTGLHTIWSSDVTFGTMR